MKLKKDGTPRASDGGRCKGQRTAPIISNDKQIKSAKRDMRVAPNLWLYVRGGSKSWCFEWMKDGKRCWHGLGAYPAVSLAKAKERADEIRVMLAKGEDPRKPIVEHRFKDVFQEWFDMRRHEWRKNADGSERRYASDVKSEVTRLALPMIGEIDVNALDTDHVQAVLWQMTDEDQPLWVARTPQAVRLRGYLQEILGYARARQWRTKFNCAVWEDNLSHLLPSPKKIHKPASHPSCHPDEIGQFMAVLRRLDGKKFRALELLILTSLRAEELRGARRTEMDLPHANWDVSPIRMKKGNEHTVLLSRQAIALINGLPPANLLFGEAAENMLREATAEVMAAAGREFRDRKTGELIVPHGFRASFGTWAAMQGFDRIQIKLALGHVVDDETLRRYLRSSETQERRQMMQRWADFLAAS